MINIYLFLKPLHVVEQLKISLLNELLKDLNLTADNNFINLITTFSETTNYENTPLEHEILIIDDSFLNKNLKITAKNTIILTENLYLNDDEQYQNSQIIYLPTEISYIISKIKAIISLMKNSVNIANLVLKTDVNEGFLYNKQNPKEKIILSIKETLIIKMLMEAHPNPLTKQQLLKEIWGFSNEIETKTLETHIHNIRLKLADSSLGIQINKNADGFIIKI